MAAHSDTVADVTVIPDQQPASLEACRRCRLWHDATQGVAGEGPRQAPIMMVGEQPGDKEDLAGKPFVGPAGALLDAALADAGVDRDDVFVTNAVKHFKWSLRGKRRMHKTPGQREIEACRYWLEKEYAAVDPRVVVALGATALKSVLHDYRAGLRMNLGKVLSCEGRLVVPTYHPSYALRAPDEASRHEAYGTIVDALRHAGRLVRQHDRR
ncbi:MAG: UdgX family uracil-DNA binding protein [Pigmentiphaga sp.]|uniref:UdgX family uracil-DNA binding protein n=1 Tax=Pigmentiphaga sp. TaxID=1977564 RepID=UPI0029B492FF|nr:UdgX family uracil-DNA binding protein [Pigmentiphaga sp.]MDX3905000.1 UdgX family uracil-DNA binding protein [Pigmentiphaga sp.]